MLVDNVNTGVEIFRVKKRTFALIFDNRSDDIEAIANLIQSLPDCEFNPERLSIVRKTYEDIANLRVLSLEDVYTVLGIDCESNIPLFSNHKRLCIRQYREIIINIIDKTQEQIKKNIHKVNTCSLTYSIFFRVQEFTEEKPKYISNMWCFGSSTPANNIMRSAFEAFTRASKTQKDDPVFCAECLITLFDAIKYSVKESYGIDYLDNVVDQLYHWYFIESEVRYDFLIFMPDVFDEIRDFLLETIDKNPFFIFVKQRNYHYERSDETETCLDVDNLVCISETLFNQMSCFRELNILLEKYYSTHRALRKYGMFNCICYDVTNTLPSTISKSLEKRTLPTSVIKPYLVEDNFIFKFLNVVQDKEVFIKTVLKPKIQDIYRESTTKETINNAQVVAIA